MKSSPLVLGSSRGPVLFTHERVGRGGEVFRLYKFRSMQHGTHDEVLGCPVEHQRYAENDFKLPEDDRRITRFGRILRSTSLDELPQFVNVLKGDMSLVGVRPLVAVELAGRSPDDQASYAQMRPGLTGLWQVAGRSSVDPVSRRALDREYIETWSNLNDVKIMLRTPATDPWSITNRVSSSRLHAWRPTSDGASWRSGRYRR